MIISGLRLYSDVYFGLMMLALIYQSFMPYMYRPFIPINIIQGLRQSTIGIKYRSLQTQIVKKKEFLVYHIVPKEVACSCILQVYVV